MATVDRDALTRRLEALGADLVPDSRLAVWDVTVVDEDAIPRVIGWTTIDSALERIRDLGRELGIATEVRVLPDPTVGPSVMAVAHRSLAHLRREPRHSAELVTQMVLGEEAIVLRDRGEWLHLQTGGGYLGWSHRASVVRRIPAEGLASFRERLTGYRPPPGTWIVTARNPVARLRPAPDAGVGCDLVRGARVVLADQEDGWLRIELPDGISGWIPGPDASPIDQLAERFPPDGTAVVQHAAEYLGLPYLWGGTSEKGFDCSGLVQRIYGLHGVPLPRDSDQQSLRGEPVDPGDDWAGVRDGDLAFFAETPGGRATHVGILSTEGRLIHSSTTRNGMAWDTLRPGDADWTDFGARLAASLTGIRRVIR